MSNIDLHNHVIPENVVQVIKLEPEKFHIKIEEKGGKRYFYYHGRIAELLPEYCDADAKVEWMNRVKLDVAAISVAPPIGTCRRIIGGSGIALGPPRGATANAGKAHACSEAKTKSPMKTFLYIFFIMSSQTV